MHRLIVVILAAVDAAIAVAVGIAATLAPLTLVWVFGLGGDADWGALWPASATIWQFGNLVPLAVTLPADYLAATGIDPAAASFTLSLAPLAFASFTGVFAARSGVRASQADAWGWGVATGAAVYAALATLIALTSGNDAATVTLWQAILVPVLVFALPALVAAIATEWREAGSGVIARVRDRVEAAPHGWGLAPALTVQGAATVVVGLIGLGALLTAVALFASGGEVVALYEAGNVDGLGATMLTLAQLAYLPTAVVWGMSFIAGPGFSIGTGTTVSPAGTQAGVVPGIPLLGAVPDSTTSWLLLLALLPVALGALAGWFARSRLVAPAAGAPDAEAEDPIAARLAIAAGISVLAASGAALLAFVASGSIGPGSLAAVGPSPGPVALAVGLEVALGAGILLLSPRGKSRERRQEQPDPVADDRDTTPVEQPDPDLAETLDLGPRLRGPDAPVD
ncbi:DUF6350 family protein [Microbacterium sp. 2FI]|uniref:cell division protein PerM n=1 Tax=Microbacterium sp. 2FI TaxID=2502193 RepID=UPI001BB2BF50|nr:DUF6350 family protein [Microbacterium sp. 2FI]